MPPEQPGQERFLQAQATKGKGDPEYIKANEDSEHSIVHPSDLVNRPSPLEFHPRARHRFIQ
jgi:hypothetical protein